MAIKTFAAKLKTAGKTNEQIIESYNGEPPSKKMIDQMRESFDLIDGCEVIVAESLFGGDDFTLFGWNTADDEKFKEFTYTMEQDEVFGSYADDRERFDADWAAGEYEPMGAMYFPKSDIEVITGEK